MKVKSSSYSWVRQTIDALRGLRGAQAEKRKSWQMDTGGPFSDFLESNWILSPQRHNEAREIQISLIWHQINIFKEDPEDKSERQRCHEQDI